MCRALESYDLSRRALLLIDMIETCDGALLGGVDSQGAWWGHASWGRSVGLVSWLRSPLGRGELVLIVFYIGVNVRWVAVEVVIETGVL